MPLMAYTAAHGAPPLQVYLQLTPMVAAAMTCILGVHWADRNADALVGKRTLVVILGHRMRWFWWACIALAYLLPLLLTPRFIPPTVAIAGLLTLPLGCSVGFRATRTDSAVPGAVLMVALMLAHVENRQPWGQFAPGWRPSSARSRSLCYTRAIDAPEQLHIVAVTR